MDKAENKSKKCSGICVLDTSEDESEGENSAAGWEWRSWLGRVHGTRRARDVGTPLAPNLNAPGPSGISSSHKPSQSQPTNAERREFWAAVSSGHSHSASQNKISPRTTESHRIQDANSTRGSTRDIRDALNQIIDSATHNLDNSLAPGNQLLGPGKLMERRKMTLDALRTANQNLEWLMKLKERNPESDASQPSASNGHKRKHFPNDSSSSSRTRTSAGPDFPNKSAGPSPAKVRKVLLNESNAGTDDNADETCSLLASVSGNTTVALEDIQLPSTPAPVLEATTTVACTSSDVKSSGEAEASTSFEQRASKAAQTVESIDLQLNQSLLSLLECPVCLECMEPPMVQCRRGHLVCRACSGRMPRCPVCRASFTSVRNRAMEQVADKLRYPCRHGCGAVVLLRLRVRHEASCARRNYSCPLPACADLAPLSHTALLQHHQVNHPEVVVHGDSHTMQVNVCTSQKDWMVFAHDQLFHLNFTSDTRSCGLYASVTYVGPKRNAKKYVYVISAWGSQNSRKLIYTRETHSDLDTRAMSYARADAFFIPMDHALHFIRPERHNMLSVNVSVHLNQSTEAQRDSGETS